MLAHFSRTSHVPVPVPALLENAEFMLANVADFQTRILGADGVCDPHQVDMEDDAMLERAVARLDTLDFVGVTERCEESCAACDRRFHTWVSTRIRREGVHRPDGKELGEYIPRIEPFLQRDRVLYEQALARFTTAAGSGAPGTLPLSDGHRRDRLGPERRAA